MYTFDSFKNEQKLNYLIHLYLKYKESFQKISGNYISFYRFLKYESFLDLKHLYSIFKD